MTQSIGAWLRAARESKGWSQKELATMVEISNVTLSNYENGRRSLSLLHVTALALELGLDRREAIARMVRGRLEQTIEGTIFLEEVRDGRFYDDPFPV